MGVLTVGGSNQVDNKIVYSSSIQATSIGIDGLFSYWTNMKYFYLSQSDPNYFLQMMGNFRLSSNNNVAGISLVDRNLSLRGIQRDNLSDTINVGSGARAEMSFYGQNVLLYFTTTGADVALPKRSVVLERLGLLSTDRFSVRLTIVCRSGSNNGNVWGKNSTLSGMNTGDYPQLKANNGADFYSITMGPGDVWELLLVYYDSTYVAYELNKRT